MPSIILDRDGVINFNSDEYIKSPDEWLPIPGSLAAISALNQAGYRVFIATNQSGVARGLYDIATLDRIHEKMHAELAKHGGHVDDIFYCPHHPDDKCYCRKPNPGLIEQIRNKHNVNCPQTFFIGDSHVDIKAAQSSGCRPVLVLTGNGERTLKNHKKLIVNVPQFLNLAAAVEYVLAEKKHG